MADWRSVELRALLASCAKALAASANTDAAQDGSSRPSMPMVTYPPPNVVLPIRKKISVSFLTEGDVGLCGVKF